MNVFPNPAKDRLNIYIISENSSNQIRIFDLTGKMIYGQTANEMLTTLDIEQLTKGMYFVKIVSEEGILKSSHKFIKE